MSSIDDVTKLIGQITVSDIEDLEDGSCRVIFDYDEKFKKEYKRLFGLKRWSKRHFEQQLEKAIEAFTEQVKTDKGLLDLRNEIINLGHKNDAST